jgi:hypothetical protein
MMHTCSLQISLIHAPPLYTHTRPPSLPSAFKGFSAAEKERVLLQDRCAYVRRWRAPEEKWFLIIRKERAEGLKNLLPESKVTAAEIISESHIRHQHLCLGAEEKRHATLIKMAFQPIRTLDLKSLEDYFKELAKSNGGAYFHIIHQKQ